MSDPISIKTEDFVFPDNTDLTDDPFASANSSCASRVDPSLKQTPTIETYSILNNQVTHLCMQLSDLAANQKETNNLLKAYVQSKQSSMGINPAPVSTTTCASGNIPTVVYMKRRGMSLLISLQKKTARKVWCTLCDKKVFITIGEGNNVQTSCGHFISCIGCRQEVLSQIARCSHCSGCNSLPSVKSEFPLSSTSNIEENCPACDSSLSSREVPFTGDFLANTFVLVNQQDRTQCPHYLTGVPVPVYCGKRNRAAADLSDREVDKKPKWDNNNSSLYEQPINYIWNASSPLVYGSVKKAFQVGSDLLTRMTYYEEDEHGLFIN